MLGEGMGIEDGPMPGSVRFAIVVAIVAIFAFAAAVATDSCDPLPPRTAPKRTIAAETPQPILDVKPQIVGPTQEIVDASSIGTVDVDTRHDLVIGDMTIQHDLTIETPKLRVALDGGSLAMDCKCDSECTGELPWWVPFVVAGGYASLWLALLVIAMLLSKVVKEDRR